MMLGLISRSFNHKSPEVMKRFYTAFVKPHLEYTIKILSPKCNKNQILLETVQRQVTKHIPTMCNLSYKRTIKIVRQVPAL